MSFLIEKDGLSCPREKTNLPGESRPLRKEDNARPHDNAMPEFRRKNIRLASDRYIGQQRYFPTMVAEGRAQRDYQIRVDFSSTKSHIDLFPRMLYHGLRIL